MANLSPITAANVVQGSGASPVTGTAGATITAGQPVYLDSATNTYKLAQATTAVLSAVRGISLNGAAANQPLVVLTNGPYNPGATVVVGTTYVVSATAGLLCPIADLVSTNFPAIVGIATTASNINVNIQAAGVAIP